MESINKIKAIIPLCTRIIHKMLSENIGRSTPVYVSDICKELESAFPEIREYDIRHNPDGTRVDGKDIYSEIYEEAVFRLERLIKNRLERNRGRKSDDVSDDMDDEKKHYIVKGDGTIRYSKFKVNLPDVLLYKKNEKTGLDIEVLECAFIIDDMLSIGRSVTNDQIYQVLNAIFKKEPSDNLRAIRNKYDKIRKEAIRRIKSELNGKGLHGYVERVNKSPYNYGEIGFSAFKAPALDNVMEVKFATFARELSKWEDTSQGLGQKINELLLEFDRYASQTGSLKGDFKKKLSEIESTLADKPQGWIVCCYQNITDLRKNYRQYVSDTEYTKLLLMYADFLSEHGLTKEFRENIDLSEGWFKTIVKAYDEAVAKAKQCEDDRFYLICALRYAVFMTRYGQPEQYVTAEALFADIFKVLDDKPHLKETLLFTKVLYFYAILCYVSGNINLSVKKLECAKELCRPKALGPDAPTSDDVLYLQDYFYITRCLADIFFDDVEGKKRDIERSVKEYKDIVDNYTDSIKEHLSLDHDFIRHAYMNLAVLFNRSDDFIEEEKVYEKYVLLSLSLAEQDCRRVEYIVDFKQDIVSWAAALRKAYGTTLKDTYKHALDRYGQLGRQAFRLFKQSRIEFNAAAAETRIYPYSQVSELIEEVNLFGRIQELYGHQDSIEDKRDLAEALERIADLHSSLPDVSCELIEREYSEAFKLYQTLNVDREYSFTMLELLSKASKNYCAHGKVTEARRMYSKLYNFFSLNIVAEEHQKHEIDIAHIMTDYASFLKSNNELEQAISVYEHTLVFCDRISAYGQDDSIAHSMAIRADILLQIAKIYEGADRVDDASVAYRNAIEYCMVEDKKSLGLFALYIYYLLVDYSQMLKDKRSYAEADAMVAHYSKIIQSDPGNYGGIISLLPGLNSLNNAKDKVERSRAGESYDSLIIALMELADVQKAYKEYTGAIDSYREVVNVCLGIEKDRPGLYVNELADAYYQLAVTYVEDGLKEEADEALDNARMLYKKLSERDGKFRNDVAKCLKTQLDLYE